MKFKETERNAKSLIGKLIRTGLTRTRIAELSGSSQSTISRAFSGQFADIDYQLGVRLENLVRATKEKV